MPRSNSIALLVAGLIIGHAATAVADINDGLIAWYPFDQGVVDKTGNIEPLESESILPILRGKFGGAVKLDGKSFITIPVDLNPDVTPSITISLWVKTDPMPTDAGLVRQLPNAIYIVSESIGLDNLNNDSTYFFGRSLNSSIVGPKHNARRGQWQHVAIVRSVEDRPDRNGKTMPHVVGQFHSGGRMTEDVSLYHGQDMATDLYIGTNSPRYQHMFRGAVDELRIYDRALTADEIGLLSKATPGSAGASQPGGKGAADTSPLNDVNFDELSGRPGTGVQSTIATIPKAPPIMLSDDANDEAGNRTSEPALPGREGTADTSSLADVNFGELGGRPGAGVQSTIATIPSTPPVMLPDEVGDAADNRINDPAFRDSPPIGQDRHPMADLGAIDPVTDAAAPGNAPDPNSADIIERQEDLSRVSQPADWRVKQIISVSPLQGVPGDIIEIRVELEKTDPLNRIPNVRVAGEGTQNYALATLNTTTEQPTATTEKVANWRIPNDFQVPGGTSRDASFLVAILDDANQPLQDATLSNNAMRATIKVFSPIVQVCGVLSFWDKRKYRSDNPGSRLGTASANTNMPLGGVDIDIWQVHGECRDTKDGCAEGDDEQFDSKTSSRSDGRFCTTTERPAEIYARTKLETAIARIERANGEPPVISSYVKNVPLHDSPQTMDWSASCPGGYTCSNRMAADAANAQTIAWTNTLATLIDVERYYGGNSVVSPKISAWVAPDLFSKCDKSDNQTWTDGEHICVRTPFSNYRVAHEAGHMVMNRALNIVGRSASKCPAGSAWTDNNFEKCATTEGFANFFAAAIFWEQDGQDPFYQFVDQELEGATEQGNNGTRQACISNGDEPHRIEGNAARFFWDLYDTRNETRGSLVDDTSTSLRTLVGVWSEFDPGNPDRKAEEAGQPGDTSNGRNAWDFVCRFPAARSELSLNCLGAQEGAVPLNGSDTNCVY